ncbi:growth arrest and DNA-damage-inducible 45 alpha, isoform CRA_b, partial [Mus musculus]
QWPRGSSAEFPSEARRAAGRPERRREGGSERRAGAAHCGGQEQPARRGRDSHLQYDFGGILGCRAEDRKDGHGGRCPGGSAQQGSESAHHYGRRVRGCQAAQRRPPITWYCACWLLTKTTTGMWLCRSISPSSVRSAARTTSTSCGSATRVG